MERKPIVGNPDDVRRLNVVGRYLTLWVGLCTLVGVALGKLLPGLTDARRRPGFGAGNPLDFVSSSTITASKSEQIA